jgi:hypothetical protein
MAISTVMEDVMTRIYLLPFKLQQFICTIGGLQTEDWGIKENKSMTETSCSSCLHAVVYRPPERLTTNSRGWVTYCWCVMLQVLRQVFETKNVLHLIPVKLRYKRAYTYCLTVHYHVDMPTYVGVAVVVSMCLSIVPRRCIWKWR